MYKSSAIGVDDGSLIADDKAKANLLADCIQGSLLADDLDPTGATDCDVVGEISRLIGGDPEVVFGVDVTADGSGADGIFRQ